MKSWTINWWNLWFFACLMWWTMYENTKQIFLSNQATSEMLHVGISQIININYWIPNNDKEGGRVYSSADSWTTAGTNSRQTVWKHGGICPKRRPISQLNRRRDDLTVVVCDVKHSCVTLVDEHCCRTLQSSPGHVNIKQPGSIGQQEGQLQVYLAHSWFPWPGQAWLLSAVP